MKTNNHRSVCGKLKQQLNSRVKRWFNSPKNGHSSTTQSITQPPNHSNGVSNLTWPPGYRLHKGKYTIEKKLGQGGLGITYLARTKTGDRIVIKTILNHVLRQDNLLEYWKIFANEAVKLAQCSCGNPHLVSLCEEIIREGEPPCLIMEYIEGETLSALVKRQGVLSEEKALLYIGQIGSALWDIHQQGLLHRDVKPNNIMVRNDGSGAVLIDLGIATKFVPGVTQTHLCGRTPGYTPLEQYEWRSQLGPYTDVYALAATLYVLLTRNKPVPADERADGAVLPPPKDFNPQISGRINQAILNAMNLVARDRPQSIPEFLNLLGIELPNNNSTNTTNNQLHKTAQVGDFYIERPQDAECYERILEPEALIRIKAPKLMGKTLLSHRILDYVCKDQPDNFFVIGQSLGGAVSIPVVAEKQDCICGLVLESTFPSYRGMARDKLSSFFLTWPFQYPLSYLVSDDYAPKHSIHKIQLPTLIIHGTQDKVVPEKFGRQIKDLMGSKQVEYWALEGAGHTAAFVPGSPMRNKLVRYLQTMSEKCQRK